MSDYVYSSNVSGLAAFTGADLPGFTGSGDTVWAWASVAANDGVAIAVDGANVR